MKSVLRKIRQKLKNLSKGKKRILALVVGLLLLVVILVGGYAARHFYTKIFGVQIAPKKDFPVTSVTYYLQNDPAWGSDTIGNSNSTMNHTGCLISCVASSMGELGIQINPGELNNQLTEIRGFEYDELLWYKLNEAFPNIDYTYSRIFTSATIDQDLENGLLPIVNVKYLNGNATHWVMIVGAENGEYLVYDPLEEQLEPIPLSVHGKVYAYRVLHTAGGIS